MSPRPEPPARIVLRLRPKRVEPTAEIKTFVIDLDAEYYRIDEVIEWINHAIEEGEIADFLCANTTLFSLDPEQYDRISCEAL